MDRHDPGRRVALVVDEWGTWYDVEPGTNPGFLYQQNTMRDALVAGLTLNLLSAHCGRVKMANIAQMVNVLQAMVLTEGARMLCTPTYHVFDLYQVHQEATLLPSELDTEDYEFAGERMPMVSAAASREAGRCINITLCNTHPRDEALVVCDLRGVSPRSVSGRVLAAGSMQAHNTFDAPEAVKPAPLTGARIEAGLVRVTLPPMSVTALALDG
jgi:alpha-N-arabinofuranosidase